MPTYQYWHLASVLVLDVQVNVTHLQTDTFISGRQVARVRTAEDLLSGRLVLSHLQLKIHLLSLESRPTLLQVSQSLSLRKVTVIACQQWPDLHSQSHIFIIINDLKRRGTCQPQSRGCCVETPFRQRAASGSRFRSSPLTNRVLSFMGGILPPIKIQQT